MEKKFDSWKESIKRSLGRKAGKDTALELRKHGKAERTQPQQQGMEQERTQQQDQKLQETEDLLGHAMKHGTWKTLKRSLGRRLGLHVRDELQEDGVDGKQQQHRHSLGDPPARLVQDVLSAGLNHEECATFAAPAAPEDLQAATPATTVPARYKVRRAHLTGSEGRTRLAVRSNGAAQLHSGVVQNTPSTPRTLPPHRGHRDLGTTPTTPGYPHPLEIALPVPKGRRKFATWSPGRKLFWCCDQHASTSGAHSLLQCSKDLRPGTPQNESEGVHGKGAAEVVAARLEDGFRWPSSADPGLLEPTLFKPVEGVVAERQVGVEAGVERSQDEEEDDVDLLPSQSSSQIPGQKKAMLPAHDQTGAGAPEEAEEEVAEVAQHLRLGLGEEIAQAAAQHHTDAGAAADEHGQEKTEALPDDAMNEELNMQQIQASIASLQQAVLSGVVEGALEPIEEEEEVPLEDGEQKAALVDRALLGIFERRRNAGVREQRAASSALLASANSSEDFQDSVDPSYLRVPEPGEWLRSRYELFPGETPAESSTASKLRRCITTAHSLPTRLRHRTRDSDVETRAEKVRHWITEWNERKAEGEIAVGSLVIDGSGGTLSASSHQLGSSGPRSEETGNEGVEPLSASSPVPGPRPPRPPRPPRLRIRSRQQIARESIASYSKSVVIDAWTYLEEGREEGDQLLPDECGNVDADAGLASIDEDAEELQAEPTDQDDSEGGRASTMGSAVTTIWRGPTILPDKRGEEESNV